MRRGIENFFTRDKEERWWKKGERRRSNRKTRGEKKKIKK